MASGSLDTTQWLQVKLLQFSIYQTAKPQQHHAALEVTLTVISMLLKRKFKHLPLTRMVDFA